MSCSDEQTAVAVHVVSGPKHDSRCYKPILHASVAQVGVIDESVADKGFDSDALRRYTLRKGIMPQLKARSTRPDADTLTYERAYHERNRVERLFCRVKQFRAIATRYDKLARRFQAGLHLTFGFIRLKALNVNRPLLRYWSHHSGGGHFAFCDGSVRFLKYSMNDLMPALATRSGNESLNLPE